MSQPTIRRHAWLSPCRPTIDRPDYAFFRIRVSRSMSCRWCTIWSLARKWWMWSCRNHAGILANAVTQKMAGVVVVVQIFNATRHPRHVEVAAIVMYMYLYSITFMDPPCTVCAAVTKRRPVPFIPNLGHLEYELGVLMVWKFSRPERESNPWYSAWKSSALTTWPPSPRWRA